MRLVTQLYVIQKMKIIQKIKNWYRGSYIQPTLEEIFDRYGTTPLENHFKPPLLAKILNAMGHFWLKHWQWIIATIIALIGIYLLYLQLIKSK